MNKEYQRALRRLVFMHDDRIPRRTDDHVDFDGLNAALAHNHSVHALMPHNIIVGGIHSRYFHHDGSHLVLPAADVPDFHGAIFEPVERLLDLDEEEAPVQNLIDLQRYTRPDGNTRQVPHTFIFAYCSAS